MALPPLNPIPTTEAHDSITFGDDDVIKKNDIAVFLRDMMILPMKDKTNATTMEGPRRTLQSSCEIGTLNELSINGRHIKVNTEDLKKEAELVHAEGGFGTVALYKYHEDSLVIKFALIGKESALEKEIMNYRKAGPCPFIVQYYGHVLATGPLGYEQIGMCMEAMEGPILRLVEIGLRMEQPTLESVVAVAAYSILGAVDHLESKNIIHRDICWRNVLVSRRGDIKLADLGVSRECSFLSVSMSRTPTKEGQKPPEQLQPNPDRHASVQSDIWGMGLVLRFLATCEPHKYMPLAENDERYYLLGEEYDRLSVHLRNYINACLGMSKDARLEIAALKKMPFYGHCSDLDVLVEGRSTIENMFDFDTFHVPFKVNRKTEIPYAGMLTR